MVENKTQMDELLSSTGGKNIVFGSFADDSRAEDFALLKTQHLATADILLQLFAQVQKKDYVAARLKSN